jgi:FkbM family methyltransferase
MKTYLAKELRTIRKVLRAMFPKFMHARAHSKMKQWAEVEEALLPVVVYQQRDAVDVGAFVGSYTLHLAKLARTVYAFEPDVEMATMLRRVAPPNVRVFDNAVSDREGTSEFHVPSLKGRRAVTCGSLVPLQGRDHDMRLVKTTTLDAALANSDVGFIKIDVEGAEQSVLVGAQQLIARCRPVILVEANTPGAVVAVSAFFEPLEYAGFFVHKGRTFGLVDFKAEMQDPRLWNEHAPRHQMRLLNNFFFAPREAEVELRTEMDRFLAREAGVPVR